MGRSRYFDNTSHYLDKSRRGFSLVELLVVVAIMMIVAAMSVPRVAEMAKVYRLRNDARGIAGQLAVARMRAGANFSRTKLECSSDSTGNHCELSYRRQGMASFVVDAPLRGYLSGGNSFGLPSGASKGAGTAQGTTAPQQSLAIVFNSRGLPVYDNTVTGLGALDSSGATLGDGAVKDNYVLYLKDKQGTRYLAVVVENSGRVNIWQWTNSGSTGWAQIKD